MLIILLSSLYGCDTTNAIVAKHCYICEGLSYHAPCLIDLSTGHILELSVYDNDPITQGKLAKDQTTGHISFTMSGDMLAITDAGNSAQISISTVPKDMNVDLFCDACQQAIHSLPNSGIVLADLYEREHIRYYILEDGSEYSFRDYMISIEQYNDNSKLQITVHGTKQNGVVINTKDESSSSNIKNIAP